MNAAVVFNRIAGINEAPTKFRAIQIVPRIKNLNFVGEVLHRPGSFGKRTDADPPQAKRRMLKALQLQPRGHNESRQTVSTDRELKDIRLLTRRTDEFAMVRMKEPQLVSYLAKVAVFELVLPVDVGSDAAADGDAWRARHDRKNPTSRHREAI